MTKEQIGRRRRRWKRVKGVRETNHGETASTFPHQRQSRTAGETTPHPEVVLDRGHRARFGRWRGSGEVCLPAVARRTAGPAGANLDGMEGLQRCFADSAAGL